ncbi:MAG TPA: NINE protein [Roseateles sp.]|nr:NINE protein [Roseateles sp.]
MPAYKSKTLATWLALLLGSFGLHRFYLHGLTDRWAWLFPWPTLAGLYGLQRMELLGQDDRLSWLLMPLLGVMLVIAMLSGIVYGLTPDEKWNAQRNPGQPVRASGWINIIGVITCLLIGGAVLMTTIAFSAQRYFETQAEAAQALSQ